MENLRHDGEIHIATYPSRLAKVGKNKKLLWSEFLGQLLSTTRTKETVREYFKMGKEEQDTIKDVGGFVGGWLKGGRRKTGCVEHRTLLTLDADLAQLDLLDMFDLSYGCAAAVYSTHKHTPEKPRLRFIAPLNRPVTAEEYEAIGRRIAYDLGIDQFDDTSYQPMRLMFYASTAADGQFYSDHRDGPWLDPDAILAQYHDWRDTSYWPTSSRMADVRKREAKKQGNPLEKPGIVGAFCRCYDINAAIEKFLPGVYTSCAIPDRYTYAKGSTAAGLVLYDGGLFAYSNHATDPTSGKLCNAFDLVRIHLYGDQDENASPDTPMSRRPSFLAMQDFAAKDTEVKRLLNSERLERAKSDFETPMEYADDENWADELDVDSKGKVRSTIDNVYIILCHDPLLKGAIAYNDLKVRPVALRSLPWRKITDTVNGSTWSDADDSAMRRYLEKYYKITGKEKIMDGMMNAARDNAVHPIQNYLKGLVWDGTPRLDTLLIDYLSAEDNSYTRAVTRKTFTAAVARIFQPGCKFDYVLVLAGPQGRGKSTLVAKMSNGWHTDSLAGIGTKEAYEGIQGYWLVELGELAAMRKLEIETIKNFISKQMDSYRAAYGRRVEDHPRQCIFIGTTNSTAFLRDDTGNRRFWPVRLGERSPAKTVWGDLSQPVIDQLWAEAVAYYHDGEKLILPPELVAKAEEQQKDFVEDDPRRGLVEDFLEVLLPTDWGGMDIGRRQGWFAEDESIKTVGVQRRNFICAAEVWAECFGKDPHQFPRQERGEVCAILRQVPGWEEEPKRQRCGPYGLQTRFRRVP
ncbi:MAG: hypothetical protein HFF84_09900 [Oscillibacter sp.]|nr:hypothetical protein [Oscillibacter sp.]